MKQNDFATQRKTLDEICAVPGTIISVYSLEKHVWADGNAIEARKKRKPELKTIEEFQIDPVRSFLTQVFRQMAAPYKPGRKDDPTGQGWWIQAEFGSGKSHVLSFLSALALGDDAAWEIVREKEKKAGRGKRESLYLFWEEGLKAKSEKGKGIFVIVGTLVGTGGGAVGIHDKGRRLTEYILDAAKKQIEIEIGKNISLYPSELLADRFLSEDLDRYRNDLKKFLKDPRFFEEDEIEDINDFIQVIREDRSPVYKQSCGNKLWRFYTEYLKVQPRIAAETEEILKHFVETILNEGYSGVLLVLDEVSLFMKNRDDNQRSDDEKTLVVLSNRLAKVYNLPVWTVCAAQQAIESKMGVKNIIADDRLKLVNLLEHDRDYYDIVLSRVREITQPDEISKYYLLYKRGFSWHNSITEAEFAHFFPFHKPAVEILKAITFELTTTRSAIHFMHQTLKHQIKEKGGHVIRLWELFDEAVRYEEDPSGVNAGLTAIKTRRESDYRAYESCQRQIEGVTKGALKIYSDKAVKIIQTLFLYYIAKTRQQGVSPEEIANNVLLEREPDATVVENIQHYEILAENLKKELRQIVLNPDEDGNPRYRFDPVFTGADPRDEFQKARDEAESNEKKLEEAWDHLLALNEWVVKTSQMNIDLAGDVKSIFHSIASPESSTSETLTILWNGRQTSGRISMRDLRRIANDNMHLPAINSDETDLDFHVIVGRKTVTPDQIKKILFQYGDPRLILWSPDHLTPEEHATLINFAGYRKLVEQWRGKESEDAKAVIGWVANSLQTELGNIYQIVTGCYGRGRMDAREHSGISFNIAGGLNSILTPVVSRILDSCYASRNIRFEPPFEFRKEEGVKVINGIVKTGEIPKGAKPNQNISAARNFGFGLKIMKKSAERVLDVSDSPYVTAIQNFIDDKLAPGGPPMKIETIYKNFMGVGGPEDYGLTRRMVDIYLLCLVKSGKIRITLGAKSGLAVHVIDYANISSIDFSVKVLNAFQDLQKVEKPENWDILRPFAEKILDRKIPENLNDAEITRYRTELKDHFAREKDIASRTQERSAALFDAIDMSNPYQAELDQCVRLFSIDIEAGREIPLILYTLKDVFGYSTDEGAPTGPAEPDDFAGRLKNYRDIKRFLEWESELKAAFAYCRFEIPMHMRSNSDLKPVRDIQKKIRKKMSNPKPYIDSELKLKTELIGKYPPEKEERNTLGELIHEYTLRYCILHDDALKKIDEAREFVQNLLKSDELQALKLLETIPALHPPASSEIEAKLNGLVQSLFVCKSPSKNAVQSRLRREPVHDCGLSFDNAPHLTDQAEKAARDAAGIFNETIHAKLNMFLSSSVRERLRQGEKEPVIRGILACGDVNAVRDVLVKACLDDPGVADTISRYLKRIKMVTVKLSDFKPGANPVEKDRIDDVVDEFRRFLEDAFDSVDASGEVLPVVWLETRMDTDSRG